MKNIRFCAFLFIVFMVVSCKDEQIVNLNDCFCASIDYKGRRGGFIISDVLKVNKLKDELANLKRIKDDGRVVFGDTLILNCPTKGELKIEINEDYVRLKNQKYKPSKTVLSLIKQYKDEDYVSKTIQMALSHIDRTKTLNLRDCNLREIPSEVFRLTNLEYLDLSVNLIKEIPKEISNLKKLKELSISYNLLERISPEISKLSDLEKFWVLDNNLENIPDEICQLESLKELNLNGNRIKKRPNCLLYHLN